jgi:Tol biopolymer transport system component
MRRLIRTLLAAASLPAVCAVSCSSPEHSAFCPSGCSDAGMPQLDSSRDGPMLVGVDHGAPKGLVVVPANSTLDVTDVTNLPTKQLTAQVTYTDGTQGSVQASWTIDRFDIASVGAGTGVVQPTGAVFGDVTVTASAMGLTGSTKVSVHLQATVNTPGFPASDVSALAAGNTTDPAVTFLDYPYDKTVFPRGLIAPEIMWDGGQVGDEYELHYVAPAIDLAVLTMADPPSRFAVPQALWNMLVASAGGNDMTVELRRLSSGTAYLSTTQTWHISSANLRGIVYYWSVSQGQILQADPTIGQSVTAFPPANYTVLGNPRPLNSGLPKTPAWENNGQGDRCVGCHSVSKDGSTIAGVFSTGGSEGPLGYVDMKQRQVTAIGDYTALGMFTAVAPDGSLSVMNTATRTMQLLDSTGAPVSSALDGLTQVCDPVFSPDGTLFALASNCNGGNGMANQPIEFASSDLELYDFTKSSYTFSNPRTVVPSGAGGGTAIAFPSFSPDSKWIVFQGGSYSRAKYGTNLHGADDLYVAAAQQGSTPIALDAANGTGVLSNDSQHLNYAPSVSPIFSGGYFWVVFTSPRDYGNRMVSPQLPPPMDATYSNHKQLWVAAIDANVGTADPSHPAFWLPGQDATTANMFGYWALAPCKPTQGDGGPVTCESGFECCSGFCRDNGTGYVCTDNPGGCHQLGEACGASSDCCNASSSIGCIGGICQTTGNQ